MKNRPFLFALPFGLLTLALAWSMPDIPALPGTRNPIVELEFARSPEDIARVLGSGGEVQKVAVENVRADRFFLLAYSAFLLVSCFLAWRKGKKHWLWLGVGLALAAALLDHLENREIMAILEGSELQWPAHLPALAWFTWMKWGSIVGVFLVLGWFLKDLNRSGRVILGLAVLAALTMGASAFVPALAVSFSTLVGLLFLLLFVWEAFYVGREQP